MRLVGFIYFHRISDNRVTGSSRNSMRLFEAMCGDSTKNVVLCTTMWDSTSIDPSILMQREKELADDFWDDMLKRGAIMKRHYNTHDTATEIVRHLLQAPVEATSETQQLSWTQARAQDSAIRHVLNGLIAELEKGHKDEISRLLEEKSKPDAAVAQIDIEIGQEQAALASLLLEKKRVADIDSGILAWICRILERLSR